MHNANRTMLPSHFIQAIALSTLIASSIASAQTVQERKCQGNMCSAVNAQNYLQPQVDVNALANKVASLEQKLTAVEAKLSALDAKQTQADGNVTKLLTHTHDVTTRFDFSSTVVSDIKSNAATVVIPIGNFGHPQGSAGQPKFN